MCCHGMRLVIVRDTSESIYIYATDVEVRLRSERNVPVTCGTASSPCFPGSRAVVMIGVWSEDTATVASSDSVVARLPSRAETYVGTTK